MAVRTLNLGVLSEPDSTSVIHSASHAVCTEPRALVLWHGWMRLQASCHFTSCRVIYTWWRSNCLTKALQKHRNLSLWIGRLKWHIYTIDTMYKIDINKCTCLPSRFSRVRLFVTPWTAAHQAPLSMGFSRHGAGCHDLLQGILPTHGSNAPLVSPALAGGVFTTSATWEAPASENALCSGDSISSPRRPQWEGNPEQPGGVCAGLISLCCMYSGN